MQTKRIVRYKVYLDRARMYVSLVQFFVVLLLITENYRQTSFGQWFYNNALWTFPVFMLVFLMIFLFIGYIDRRFVRSAEQEEYAITNPVLMDMKHKIDKLYETISEQEVRKAGTPSRENSAPTMEK